MFIIATFSRTENIIILRWNFHRLIYLLFSQLTQFTMPLVIPFYFSFISFSVLIYFSHHVILYHFVHVFHKYHFTSMNHYHKFFLTIFTLYRFNYGIIRLFLRSPYPYISWISGWYQSWSEDRRKYACLRVFIRYCDFFLSSICGCSSSRHSSFAYHGWSNAFRQRQGKKWLATSRFLFCILTCPDKSWTVLIHFDLPVLVMRRCSVW